MRCLSLALALALSVGATAVRAESAAPEAPSADAGLPAISVTTVGTRLMRDRVVASGLVGPVERVQVQPLIEGQPIETLLVDVGDTVAAGQVMARLSASTLDLQKSQFEAALASAKAQIAQADAQLLEAQAAADEAGRVNERTKALKEKGNASQAAADQASAGAISASARVVVARESLEAARAQVALAEAQLANVELQLARTEVKAPVSGQIVERNALVGAVASAAGQPMFVLVKDSALELAADVSESDLVRLRPDQKAVMRSVGGQDPINGIVRLIEPAIDTATRLGRARIWIAPDAPVVQGMFLDAEILLAERESVAVPVTAIGAAPEGAIVMRVEDGVAHKLLVKTGIRDGGWIEITEGLAAGDTVVLKAVAFVRDGDRINPVPAATN